MAAFVSSLTLLCLLWTECCPVHLKSDDGDGSGDGDSFLVMVMLLVMAIGDGDGDGCDDGTVMGADDEYRVNCHFSNICPFRDV